MLFTEYAPSRTPAYYEAVDPYGLPFLGMYYFPSSGNNLLQSSPGTLQCDVMDLPAWIIYQVIASAVNPSETIPLLFSLVPTCFQMSYTMSSLSSALVCPELGKCPKDMSILSQFTAPNPNVHITLLMSTLLSNTSCVSCSLSKLKCT